MSTTSTAQQSTEFINNPVLKKTLFTAEQIQERVRQLGAQITADYAGKELYIVGVLKGSCIFMADLIRHIDLPIEIDFMAVSSYKGATSSGYVEIIKDLMKSIENKHVIVVEDIVDTGLTLSHLVELLNTRGATSIRLATLLDKPEPRIKKDLVVDYTGFSIANEFVIGYGLDFDGRFRNLPFIAVYNTDQG
jgi:hypoxanthine phosphoribosyltransferase